MDIATIIGLILGFGAIIGGQVLEGGHLSAIMQGTAAIIILGGTLGATFVSFPFSYILQAAKDVKKVFKPPQTNHENIIKDIIGYAAKARKNGLISLEQESQNIKDVFIKKGISLVVDGIDPQKLRETMETELSAFEEHSKISAEVFEAAGGYAPDHRDHRRSARPYPCHGKSFGQLEARQRDRRGLRGNHLRADNREHCLPPHGEQAETSPEGGVARSNRW